MLRRCFRACAGQLWELSWGFSTCVRSAGCGTSRFDRMYQEGVSIYTVQPFWGVGGQWRCCALEVVAGVGCSPWEQAGGAGALAGVVGVVCECLSSRLRLHAFVLQRGTHLPPVQDCMWWTPPPLRFHDGVGCCIVCTEPDDPLTAKTPGLSPGGVLAALKMGSGESVAPIGDVTSTACCCRRFPGCVIGVHGRSRCHFSRAASTHCAKCLLWCILVARSGMSDFGKAVVG